MRQLDDKVALVTGSGRGLGRACAQIFARDGARVVVVDLNSTSGEETVELIRRAGGEALFVEANIARPADVQRMVRMAVDQFGGLDRVINNAICILNRTPLADIEEEDRDRALAVNFTGVFPCARSYPGGRRRRSARMTARLCAPSWLRRLQRSMRPHSPACKVRSMALPR